MTSAAPYSGPPRPGTAVPAAIRELAGPRPVHPVWLNELGGLTFRLGDGPAAHFAKWTPRDTSAGAAAAVDLTAETVRLRWAAPRVRVPEVLAEGADDAGSWFVTAALPGEMAVADRWKADPATAVRVIGEGLRAFHDALPVAECPFSWSAEERLAEARANLDRVRSRPFHADYAHLTVDEVMDRLADIPPVDELVVCHGDTCAPNTLIAEDGRFAGHVDLGLLGVADRWADLAVATWSTTWNYGPGWELPLLAAYGVEPDPGRTEYYRLLWQVGP